jgi:uncharacterized protein YbjT (DUF2867 family)
MRILVTGGTGVVGRSTVTALLQHGHVVRLFSRHAEEDHRQWAHGVHPVRGDVGDASTVHGAADRCDAVLHLTAVVDEQGAQTFARVNVEGTRNMVREAERAGVPKFVFVSSLGADRGESPYHRSKRQAEAIVRQFSGAWTIVRPGSVYGPGDDQVSLLLRMVRTLPVLPMVHGGADRFQPVWHEDLADALARVVERDDLAGRELDVAGPELTSQHDLSQRLAGITGRASPSLPLPGVLAEWGAKLAQAAGVELPLNDSQLRMLREGNAIAPGRENALTAVLGVPATPLDRGLRMLADAQDEQLPDHGVGPVRRKRYWADISSSALTAEQLMDHVRSRFGALMASFIETMPEPRSNPTLVEDATITLSLPLRGHIQVRVAELEPRVTTLVTLDGHPMAGAVRFLGESRGEQLRFEAQVFDRAAGVLDYLMMRALGDRLQDASWHEMVRNVVRAAGGMSAGVQQETETLDETQAGLIEDWLRELVMARRRDGAGV